MIQSMTGYGEVTLFNMHCEIKTLNHRFLSISISLPPPLSTYEFKIRDLLSTYIKRGAVFLKLSVEGTKIEPDIKRAKAYYDFVKELKDELGLTKDIPIDPFLEFKKEKMPGWRDIKAVVFATIRKLVQSRIEEGKKIKSDIEQHLNEIGNLIRAIRKKIPDPQKIEKEFKSKLKSFTRNELDSQKVREELTLLLIRENFNEEVTRLAAHFQRFKQVFRSKGVSPRRLNAPTIGKELAFLIQEMQREANTISAKAKDAEISQLTVTLKTELESIREQVENVS